jgi:hypothetical protein
MLPAHVAGDFIEGLLAPYQDAPCLAVCATACVARFSESEGIPLCRDQVGRLIAISITVNAKFWDDGAVGDSVNLKVASAAQVPRDDFNAMEMSFLR